MRTDAINVAHVVPRTRVEGPGARYALWVQGCPLRCPGCCNPELLAFVDAHRRRVAELVAEVLAVPDLDGVTLLGGEPFAQAPALATWCHAVRQAGLGVMIFTGYKLEVLRRDALPGAAELLSACDLLVDGPFLRTQASKARRWVGSDNQGVHFLTERYAHLRDTWPAGDGGIELRLGAGALSVNGDPRAGALDGWLSGVQPGVRPGDDRG